MTMTTTSTLWLCTDCMLTLANGECGENPDREPLGLLDGCEVSCGLARDEHTCNYEQDWSAGDCRCEYEEFVAYTKCPGCGSNLGGSRYAATAWFAS